MDTDRLHVGARDLRAYSWLFRPTLQLQAIVYFRLARHDGCFRTVRLVLERVDADRIPHCSGRVLRYNRAGVDDHDISNHPQASAVCRHEHLDRSFDRGASHWTDLRRLAYPARLLEVALLDQCTAWRACDRCCRFLHSLLSSESTEGFRCMGASDGHRRKFAAVDHVVARLRLGMGLGQYAALSGRRAIGASAVSLARDVNRHAASTAQSISESAIHVDGDIAVYRDDQLFSGMLLVPVFLQNVQGHSPLDSGMILLPATCAMAIMSLVVGRLYKVVGPMPLLLVGVLLMAAGNLPLAWLKIDSSSAYTLLWMTVRSLGLALVLMPATTAGMEEISREYIGHASAECIRIVRCGSIHHATIFTYG